MNPCPENSCQIKLLQRTSQSYVMPQEVMTYKLLQRTSQSYVMPQEVMTYKLNWLYFSGHTDLDKLEIRQGGVSSE